MNQYPTSFLHYDTRTIRQLLLAAFTDEEFTIFCYDYYPAVYREFTLSITFSAKVQLLINNCAKLHSFDTLLALVQQSNSNQYARFALALQPTVSESPNKPANRPKAMPDNKLKHALIGPTWPIGWLALVIVVTFSWAGFILNVGLVVSQHSEPVRLSIEPISQLTAQPTPEPPSLLAPIVLGASPTKLTRQTMVEVTTEPALEPIPAGFIEPAFEPMKAPATPATLETLIEPLFELAMELPVGVIDASPNELESESIIDLADEPSEPIIEPTVEPTVESAAEQTVEPLDTPTVDPSLMVGADLMHEAGDEPIIDAVNDP